MKVLVACEWTGRVRDAFRDLGHDAYSCDLISGYGEHSRYHYRQDVRELLTDTWDMMIAFPPCTYLSNMGANWMNTPYGPQRLVNRHTAVQFVCELWNAPIPKIAIENPRGYLTHVLGEPAQYIHPHYFGEPYSKETGLWLKGLPPLRRTDICDPDTIQSWMAVERDQSRRGMTFRSIAKVMADQWS